MSKKIYSFLLGGAVALAAFAATEFVGNGTVVKNDLIEDYKPIFAQASASVTDQTITVTYDLSSNAQILIHNHTEWEPVVAAEYGKTNTNIVVTCVVNGVTKTATQTAGSTGSFKFENLEVGTYPVSLTAYYDNNPTTVVTPEPTIVDQVVENATPSGPENLYFVARGSTWTANLELELKSDGTYKLELENGTNGTNLANMEFILSEASASKDVCYAPTTMEEVPVTLGSEMKFTKQLNVQNGAANYWRMPITKTPTTIVVDLQHGYFTVTAMPAYLTINTMSVNSDSGNDAFSNYKLNPTTEMGVYNVKLNVWDTAESWLEQPLAPNYVNFAKIIFKGETNYTLKYTDKNVTTYYGPASDYTTGDAITKNNAYTYVASSSYPSTGWYLPQATGEVEITVDLNNKTVTFKQEVQEPEPEAPAYLYMLDAEGNTLATLKQEGETAIISGDYQKVTDSGVDFIISDKERFVEGAQYLKLAGTYGSGDYESWLNPNDDYTNKVATLLDSKPTELNHFDTADLALYNISVDWSNKEVTITKVREYTKTIDEPTFTYEVYNNVIILTVTAPASGAIMDGGTEIATMDYKNTHFQVYLKVGETALNEDKTNGDDIMGGATYTKTYTGVYGETLACTAKVIGVNLIDKTMNESVVLPTAALEINTPTLDTDLNNVTVEWGAFTVSNENVTFQVFVLSKDNGAIVWQSEAGLTGNSAKIPSNKFEYDVQYDIMVVATWSYGTADASKEFDGITGIDALTVDGGAVYFDVNGRQVVNPENGLYIRVANGKAQKMIIRK